MPAVQQAIHVRELKIHVPLSSGIHGTRSALFHGNHGEELFSQKCTTMTVHLIDDLVRFRENQAGRYEYEYALEKLMVERREKVQLWTKIKSADLALIAD